MSVTLHVADDGLDTEFLDRLRASLQADENDKALYGWMVEERMSTDDSCGHERSMCEAAFG